MFHKGHGGTVVANGSSLNVITWQLQLSKRLAETTNSQGAGYASFMPTVAEASGSCECVWDSTVLPDTDLGLLSGASAATFVLYAGDSTKFYGFSGWAETLSMKVNNQQDVVKFDLAFKASGVITLPVT